MIGYKKLSEECNLLLDCSYFYNKVLGYQEHDLSVIQSNTTNNCYSKEFKHPVAKEHLDKGISVRKLSRKYNIPADSTVKNCIIKYTKGKNQNCKKLFKLQFILYRAAEKHNIP